MTKVLLRDHEQLDLTKWLGIYQRGLADSCPKGYFLDTLNTKFFQTEVGTRDGFTKVLTLANIRRIYIYKRLNETPRYLTLDTSGNLYDSLYPGTPIVSDSSFTDFSAINNLNHAYITFHTRTAGVTASKIYVYDGAGPGTIRFAAGSPPSSFTMDVADSANAGNVEAGTHLFAWVFETSSGYLTSPGPEIFAQYTAPGNKKVYLDNAPIGPSGTTARILVATKVISDYDGNQFGTEFFFVPGATIPDNTTTTLDNVNFYDSDLLDSADYLFENRPYLPGALGMLSYNGRIVAWGVPGFEHYLFVSKQGEPEVFDETAGVVFIDPSDSATGIKNCVTSRGILYINTSDKCYSTSDNGSDPNTWAVISIDAGIGAEIFSISKIQDSTATNADRFFQAHETGLYVFEEGVFKKPDFSWNILSIWNRIHKAYFNKVQVVHDPKRFTVYVSVPLDSATECSHLLVADYSNSFGKYGQIVPEDVRWAVWSFPWNVMSIAGDINSTLDTVLKMAGTSNIYVQDESSSTDDGTSITSFIKTALLYESLNYMHHYGFLTSRIVGSGTLTITLYSLDDLRNVVLNTVTLSATPGRRVEKPINFTTEKMSVKFSVSGKFTMFSSHIDCKPIWAVRPNV